jgi:uncharacterized protein
MSMLGTAIRAFIPRKRHDHMDKLDPQVASHLTPAMQEFIQRTELAFIAIGNGAGERDGSLRTGPAGFIRVLDEHTIAYPEYRGNGVLAGLGNMAENPQVGVFLADFTNDLIGLYVNGRAILVVPARMSEFEVGAVASGHPGPRPVQWVVVHVTEAYIQGPAGEPGYGSPAQAPAGVRV